MNILIVGAGKVGEALIENLSKEKHDIIVVDEKIELVEKLVDTYDIIGTVGNGASYDVLINAKIQKADMLIAVTNSDEINMLCCIIGKKLGVKDTIARVRNPEYSLQLDLLQQEMGIDMVINPEFEAANDIFRMLQFPSASNVESFAKGRVNIVEGKVSANSDLIGVSLTELRKSSKLDILICVVTRDSQVLIPRGDFVLQEGDGIYVTGTTQQLILFFKQQGVYKKNVRDVLMIGGGKISYYLAKKLIKQGIQVKIIERHERRCLELSQKLKEATIVHNDGTLHEVLDEERLARYDACITLTGIDEENIVTSIYAESLGVPKIVTKISRINLVPIIEKVGLSSYITPKHIMATRIVRYVRAKQNTQGSNVERLYRIVNNQVEALEFYVSENFQQIGVSLEEMKLKENILIPFILRGNTLIYPTGKDMICEHDRVIVVTTQKYLRDLNDILEGNRYEL